jgi:hypothetical protein
MKTLSRRGETLKLSYGAPRKASRESPTLVVERLKAALPKEITIEKPRAADVGHTGEE